MSLVEVRALIYKTKDLSSVKNAIILSVSYVRARKMLEHQKLKKEIFDFEIQSWKKINSLDILLNKENK